MKVAVIYRACGSELAPAEFNPVRPSWFNKLLCWDSYYTSIGYCQDFDTHVVYDGERDWLLKHIESFNQIGGFDDKRITIHRINYNSNEKSLLACYDLATCLEHYDAFYFLEDDYMHRGEANFQLVHGLSRFGLVTLYEHMDRYLYPAADLCYGKEFIFIGKGCYWRSVESTTCTVAMTREMFKTLRDKLYNFKLNDRAFFRDCLKEDIRLFSPMPGYSTHCDKNLLSPFVDWTKV